MSNGDDHHNNKLLVNPSCLEGLEILRKQNLISLKTAPLDILQPGNGVLGIYADPTTRPSSSSSPSSSSTAAIISDDDAPNPSLQSAWNPDKVTFDDDGVVISLDLGGRRLHRGFPCDPTLVFSTFASHLTTLNLAGTDIPLDDCLAILRVLLRSSGDDDDDGGSRSGGRILKNLHLGGNGLGSKGASAIAASGVLSRSVTKLDLRYNDIDVDGIAAICDALLETNNDNNNNNNDDYTNNIHHLYLEGNYFGDEGCASLSKLLSSPQCSIREIYLGQNRIGPAGARSLASSLRSNDTLSKMYLEGNHIGEEGAAAFCEMMEGRREEAEGAAGASTTTTSPLKYLYVDNNNIGKEMSNRLARALGNDNAIADIS